MTDTATVETLTSRQQQVLAFVRTSTADHGYPPSIREIADAVGLSSNSSVVHQLRALESKGLLRRNGNSPRALTLTDATERACSLDPETVADEFGIKGLAIDNGIPTLTITPTSEQARELVLAMSLACGRMLDDDQAPNYVEFEVSPAGHPGYVVHVRRAGGPSPHTLRQEAESRAAKLEVRLDRVTDLFERWAAEEAEHRRGGFFGIAEGLNIAIEELRAAVHGEEIGRA